MRTVAKGSSLGGGQASPEAREGSVAHGSSLQPGAAGGRSDSAVPGGNEAEG